MGAQYGLDDLTSDEEILTFGGRSFSELLKCLKSSPAPCSYVNILDGCEYIGFDDREVDPVRFDGETIAQDAAKVIASLSSHDNDDRVGAFLISEWIDIFEGVRSHALDHPDHRYRPQYCE